MKRTLFLMALTAGGLVPANRSAAGDRGKPWKRHTIGQSSRRADGVLITDVNRDGLMDAVTCGERDNLGVIRNENPTR